MPDDKQSRYDLLRKEAIPNDYSIVTVIPPGTHWHIELLDLPLKRLPKGDL